MSTRTYDPTASASSHWIASETHSLGVGERVIFPSQGPYYQSTLVVRSQGQVLTPDRYQCLVLHAEATQATGKPVMLFVKILDPTLLSVDIAYQVVGGIYQDTYSTLTSFTAGLGSKLVSPIRWTDIMDKPDTFAPAPHYHPYWELSDWGDLNPALGHALQGIYAKAKPKYQKVFDYLDVQLASLKQQLDSQIGNIVNQTTTFMDQSRHSVGTVKLSAIDNNPSNYTDGVWSALNGGVIGSSSNSILLGQSITLSADISYPQPDNILLDESMAPILSDGNDFIYLDNSAPATVGDPTFDYSTLNEYYNVLGIAGYVKQTQGADFGVSLTADQTTLTEGGSVTFTLQTYRYDAPLTIPYQITGIGSGNINQPLSGMLTTDANGHASLTVQLGVNTPATDSSTMTLTCAIGNQVSTSVFYTLASNQAKSMSLSLMTGIGGLPVSTLTIGDLAYLKIASHHFEGNTVRFNAALDGGGGHQIWINSQLVTGGIVDVTLPTTTGDIYLPIRCIQKDTMSVSNLSINVSYGGQIFASTVVPATLFTMDVNWIDAVSGHILPSVLDGQQYQLQITHNSTMQLSFAVNYTTNTIANQITPSGIGPILESSLTGATLSPVFTFQRTNDTVNDQVVVGVTNPMLTSNVVSAGFVINSVAHVVQAVNIGTGVSVDSTLKVVAASAISTTVNPGDTAVLINPPFVTSSTVQHTPDTVRISIPDNVSTTIKTS